VYIALGTRPDIAFSVGILSKFADKPQKKHWCMVKCIIRYLKDTTTFDIMYRKDETQKNEPYRLIGYVNAAHGNSKNPRRPTCGYVFLLAGGAFS
jgi:hypothetical protein